MHSIYLGPCTKEAEIKITYNKIHNNIQIKPLITKARGGQGWRAEPGENSQMQVQKFH